jgi:hypothetical protein
MGETSEAERTVCPDWAGLRLDHLQAGLPECYTITGQIVLENVAERTVARDRKTFGQGR